MDPFDEKYSQALNISISKNTANISIIHYLDNVSDFWLSYTIAVEVISEYGIIFDIEE